MKHWKISYKYFLDLWKKKNIIQKISFKIYIMEFSLLEILYFVLIIFTIVIGTLLSIVLFRVLQLLDIVSEIVWYYKKIKRVVAMYNNIPSMVKEKIKSFF